MLINGYALEFPELSSYIQGIGLKIFSHITTVYIFLRFVYITVKFIFFTFFIVCLVSYGNTKLYSKSENQKLF